MTSCPPEQRGQLFHFKPLERQLLLLKLGCSFHVSPVTTSPRRKARQDASQVSKGFNDRGAAFTRFSYTGTQGHQAARCAKSSSTAGDTQPGASILSAAGRATPGREKGGRLRGYSSLSRLRSYYAAPPVRGVLVPPRTLSGGHRERARGLALSRPAPLASAGPEAEAWRPSAPPPPPPAASHVPWCACAEADRRTRARGEGGPTSLRESGSAHAGVRGHGEKVAPAGRLGFLWLCS